MTGTLASVAENTIAGALKLKELVTEGELFFFCINMKDLATEFKFDDVHDSCHLRNDSIMCAIEVLIAGESVLVCGYGDVDECCVFDVRDSGGRVFLVDCEPICVLQACLEVLQVAAIGSVVSRPTWLAWRAWKG